MQYTAILSAAVVAACAGGVMAAPFSIGSVDMGGGFVGTNGSPLVPVGGTIVVPSSTDPVSQRNSGSVGGLTFVAIEDNSTGGIGIGEPQGVQAVSIVPAGGLGSAGATFFGGFWATQAVGGSVTTSDDDAFVARITLTSGAGLATSGQIFVAVQGQGDASETILGIDETGVVSVTGPDHRTDGADYALEIRFVGTLPQGDIYEVFVVVPTPGMVAVFGVAGIVVARRRRQ